MIETEGMSDKMIDRLAPEFASFPNLMGVRKRYEDMALVIMVRGVNQKNK